MRIVFFGTSDFGIPAFRALLRSGHEISTLVTQPDRARGRSLKVMPPAMKVEASANGIKVFQPKDASGAESVEHLKNIGADLFVVISFGQILKTAVLSLPRLGCVNVHASLLPKYRGAAPTNWAIINGEDLTGVTVMKMNEKMDEGDIILQKEVRIGRGWNNIILSSKLSEAGSVALTESLEIIQSQSGSGFNRQNNALATYAPKLKKSDGLIDWTEDAAVIDSKVRGLLPWPSAYTGYAGKILKILNAEIVDLPGADEYLPGQVVDLAEDGGVVVKAGSGFLAIKELQLEGKKAMDAASFMRGHRMTKGYRFGIK